MLAAKAVFAAGLIAPPNLAPDAYLEANLGQADSAVAFVARGPGYVVGLRRNGSAVYSDGAPLAIDLVGQQIPAGFRGEQPLVSVTNYYRGDPANWHPRIPHFEGARFREVYPHIDLLWLARGPDLEYEFVARAGADPNRIRVRFTGAGRVWADAYGNLLIETPSGKIQHRRPIAWQEVRGQRREVAVSVRLEADTAGFALGPYDRKRPLWIDPVLSYSTYIGGSGYDAGYAIAVDGAGGVYLTGTTSSIGFPALGSGINANNEAFVMKFNETGALLYTTVLASNGNTAGQAIAVDSSGDVYITGYTEASNFPVTAGAWQTFPNGISSAFAAKLSPSGTLLYATYIGGAGQTTGTGVAIDETGCAYVTGYTSAAFPTTSGAAQTVYGGGFADAFVVKLNAAGSAAVYSTLLGAAGNDEAQAIVVDGAGEACIAGYSDSTNLATASAFQISPGGEGDALVACLNATGTVWTTVSYLGGSNFDQAYALDIDSSGNLYVAGTTFSPDFPVTAGVLQGANAGAYDAFVAKLSPGAGSVLYATFLGGDANDTATAIAVGSAGDVWVGGYTASMNFPLAGAWQSVLGGSFDGFASHLSPTGAALLTSSYLGGAEDDRVLGIAVDSATGLVFTTGSTISTNFPVTSGAMQTAAPVGMNAFLSAISPSAYSISGQVTTATGPLGGVSLMLSGSAGGLTETDVDGNFLFNNLTAGGTYTITPTLTGYTFAPPSQIFADLSANQSTIFSAANSYTISGQVTLSGGAALSGVVVVLSGTACNSVVTTASGYYSFTGLAAGSYSVTPSLTGYSFNPGSQPYTSLNSNQTADFVASSVTETPQTGVIWQDPVSGYSQMWYMGGSQGTTFLSADTITVSNVWRIAAMTDFNGDGYPDIIWQDPVSGASQIWFMGGAQGVTMLEAAELSGPNPWHIVGACDFNRDGHPDLVWQDPVSGWVQIWYMGGPQGITFLSAANLTLRNPWAVVGCADFNGDGQPDMLWQDPVSGTVQIWYLTGPLGNELLSAVNLTGAETWQLVAVADFNGDGHPDVVWQDPTSGASDIWLLGGDQGTTQLGTATLSGPNPWRIVAPR
ncbi:MAG: SBBP repeat-containing protein [Bryobacteraceae bacterium]